MTSLDIVRDLWRRPRCQHRRNPVDCVVCTIVFSAGPDWRSVARVRIAQALQEAGIVLKPGEFVTKEQYALLPQWFRDELEAWGRECIERREAD